MKRIVAFLNSYVQKSGGDVCFVEIFKRLQRSEMTIITSSGGKKFCLDEGLNAQFVITTKEKYVNKLVYTYLKRIVFALVHNFKIKNADIIYITSDALPDVLPALLLKFRFPKSKVIGKIFHFIPSQRFISNVHQKIGHFLLRIFADYIIVDNSTIKKTLISSGISTRRILINYPGINSERILKIKPVKKYTATYLGRIHHSKGIFDLLDIWKKVIEKDPGATLGIMGTGTTGTVKKIREIIRKYKMEKNVFLSGFVNDKTAIEYIKGSNIFLFPSHEEGFGITVAEVLACNVPVVAYNLDVFRETFNDSLITVPAFDTVAFARKIISVIKNRQKYSSKVIKGNKIIRRFTWEKASERERKIL